MTISSVGQMLVSLIGTICVINMVALFLETVHTFSKLRGDNNRWLRVLFYSIAGGLFGIYATAAGYVMPDSGAVVTIRDTGPMLAGFAGGPFAGLFAGIIAGVYRLLVGLPNLTLGTTIPCSISTVIIGLISGFVEKFLKSKSHQPLWGLLHGALMEVLHLTLVFFYIWMRDGSALAGWNVISTIAIQFILCNSLAFGLIVLLQNKIRSLRKTETHAKQVEGELNVATHIQDSMLPKIMPTFPGRIEFSISGVMNPAKEVGGDFYDFFFIDNDHFAFLIADVSGKGIPSALFMVIAKTLIKTNVQSGLPLGEAMTKANLQLLEGNNEHMFVTCWIGSIEISTGKLTYVNCGHNPPIVHRNGQPLFYLRNLSGFVLAGSKKTQYKEFYAQVNENDKIFLYTDGITEAMDKNNNQYGEQRLIDYLTNCNHEASADQIIQDVNLDVKKFANGAEQSDDMTILAMRFNGFYQTISVPVTIESYDKIVEFAQEKMKSKNVDQATISKMLIVIDELFSNVVKYSGSQSLDFSIFVENKVLSMKFKYGGTLFDVTKAKEPDVNAPLAERKIGGLGIFIVKKMSDNMAFLPFGQKAG